MNTTKTTSNNRARWAAIGAAVAVSLGAGGLGIAQATVDSGPMNIYQAINPCRLSDTRPAPDLVGPRTTPLGANETYTFDGWGTVGNCTLPSNTAALELNVTAIGATAPTFLTLFPAGATMPTASNLNPVPGEPPTPNSVTVTLAADGKFSIFNAYGSVNFIIDVVGYYEDHMHRGEDIVDSSLTRVDILDEAGIATDDSSEAHLLNSAADVEIADVQVRVPADGWVKVDVAGNSWGTTNDRDWAQCQITKGSTTIDDSDVKFNITDHDGDDVAIIPLLDSFASHRVFEVSAADNPPLLLGGQEFSLVCTRVVGAPSIVSATITLTYYSTNREAGLIIGPIITLAADPADG